MMPCSYTTLRGQQATFDLDGVVDVIRGPSPKRAGWRALIVYQADTGQFIELRDSPQDWRGNSMDEAEEVTSDYVCREFGIDYQLLRAMIVNPNDWVFIDGGGD
jgi:hypothetical protein